MNSKEQPDPSKALLRWYERYGRDLPWRDLKDPYKIWVSEILLQQTQVSRCIEYYRRFLEKFPDIRTLAKASWRNVLPVWRGLGYYRRGQNMLKAAKVIVEEWDGAFPEDYDELLSLPGVGPYTAAAISSFAYKKPYPALDTNLERVFQRYYGIRTKSVKKKAEQLFRAHPRIGAKMNHAFMDIGALFCKSHSTDCEHCPLRRGCRFSLEGKTVKKRKTARKTKSVQEVGAACIHRDGKYLLAKRPKKRGGKWEFPGGKREQGESLRDCLKREILEELGVEVSVRPPFLSHDITVKDETFRLRFCRCQILRGKEKPFEHDRLAWIAPDEFEKYPIAETNHVAVARLKK